MKWHPAWLAAPLAALSVPALAGARIYASVDDAQQRLFPGQKMSQSPVLLSDAQREQMRAASSVREPFNGERVWRAAKGGWLVVDEVVGKHEMVKYALAINADGTIRGVEILEYVESYGYEVADPAWRGQFVGKTVAAPLKLNQDIRNISGATLSCKHLTDGIKRLMVMHDLVLKNQK